MRLFRASGAAAGLLVMMLVPPARAAEQDVAHGYALIGREFVPVAIGVQWRPGVRVEAFGIAPIRDEIRTGRYRWDLRGGVAIRIR